MSNQTYTSAVTGRIPTPTPYGPTGVGERTAGRLVIATFLAACAASALDLAVFGVAGALWNVPATFVMLAPASAIIAATIGSVIAGLGLFAIVRIFRRPVPIFVGLLATATLLSLAGPLLAMA